MTDLRGLIKWSMTFLRPYRGRVGILAVLLLLEVGLNALQPLLLKVVIDYVLLPNPIPEPIAGWLAAIHEGNPVVLLVTLVIVGVVVQLGAQFVSAYSTQVQVDTGQHMVYSLRYQLFQHLQTLGLHHHITTSTGDAARASASCSIARLSATSVDFRSTCGRRSPPAETTAA